MPAPRVSFNPNVRVLAGRFAAELLAARAVAGLTQRQVARRASTNRW